MKKIVTLFVMLFVCAGNVYANSGTEGMDSFLSLYDTRKTEMTYDADTTTGTAICIRTDQHGQYFVLPDMTTPACWTMRRGGLLKFMGGLQHIITTAPWVIVYQADVQHKINLTNVKITSRKEYRFWGDTLEALTFTADQI